MKVHFWLSMLRRALKPSLWRTAIPQLNRVLKYFLYSNKIDLPQAEPERVIQEIEDIIGIEATEAPTCSAETGLGIEGVLETLVNVIPAPTGDRDAPLQALIIDSWFDNYLGVVSLVRIKQGRVRKGDKMLMKSTGQTHIITSVGIFNPKHTETGIFEAG